MRQFVDRFYMTFTAFFVVLASVLIVAYAYGAEAKTVTLEQQTDAVAELFRLKQENGKTPKEYHWFMIGQHVSSNGKEAIGYPTYKLFKDELTCETELSVIKDDPPPIVQDQSLSCHPIKQKETSK